MRRLLPKLYCAIVLCLFVTNGLRAQVVNAPVEVFFNYPVAEQPQGLPSAYTGDAISSAAVALVDAATETVDLAAYNFDHAPLASALRRAAARGVRVRVVTDIDTRHPSLKETTPNYFWIPVNDEGLMHHKFLVVDASLDEAAVLMGSTNFTDANIYRFYNDALLLRSKSLAEAYELEFELLWGSNTDVPNIQRSRSGSDKPQRRPSTFEIGGLQAELFFSPNDEVSTRIVSAINAAQHSLGFQLLVLTYDDIGQAISQAHARGVEVFGIVENFDDPSSEYNFLRSRGVSVIGHVDNEVVHHKYGVIDAERGADATLITGSHNWTYSAETFHDENTLVITNAPELARLYYEAARQRHCDLLPAGQDCQAIVSSQLDLLDVALRLSPNPSPGILRIGLADPSYSLDAYRVLDAAGRTVRAGVFQSVGPSAVLDLSSLPANPYTLQVLSGERWSVGKQLFLTP